MKPLLLFLLLSTAAWGQDNKPPIIKTPDIKTEYPKVITITSELPDLYYFRDSDTVRAVAMQTDTTPVTILVRIQGRPWAFFHDGWEVRKVSEDRFVMVPKNDPCNIIGCTVFHQPEFVPNKVYSHLLYLDSRKRPIRKEWVVYQTFKR